MAWPPILSWILSSSSSSSSLSSEYESDDNNNDIEHLDANNNVHQDIDSGDKLVVQENDDDDHIDIDDHQEDDVSYDPQFEDLDEEDQNSNSSDYTFTTYEPRPKRRRIDCGHDAFTPVQDKIITKRGRFKRVWSKEDELELLRGFLDHYNTRQINRTTRKETASFYDSMKPKLNLECNKIKLVEKLRRLKKKYHNAVNKMNNMNFVGKEFRFRNPHDKEIFEISHRIWNVHDNNCVVDSKYNNNNVDSSSVADHDIRVKLDDNGASSLNENDIPGMIIGLAMNPIPMSLSKIGKSEGEVVDDKWRKQQVLELEAYSKRLDLVQHRVKAALEEFRSKGGDDE